MKVKKYLESKLNISFSECLKGGKNVQLLKDKVCLITGTNRGIGAAVLKRFAQEGAIIYANARKQGSLENLCHELRESYGVEIIPMYFDITDEKSVKEAFVEIKKQHNRLDVLVNNAGIMQDALIGMINRKLMEDIFSVNVFAAMNMIQMANKIMSRQKSGSIINMASIVGTHGNRGQMVYSASKGAVVAFTKTAAKELAPNFIRVNAIAPGMIDTDMFHSIGEAKMNENLQKILMGRLGTPEEVADACVFLGSDLSIYITGQILGVDGGAII